MCGIAGAISLDGTVPLEVPELARMLTLLSHRGPEAAGVWIGDQAALGHARLSIIDIEGGLQPICNEDGTCWSVVNGEVYNYLELRSELVQRGHHFRTASDSEVILHLYEERGDSLFDALNGQFAFALWDGRRGKLMLARDRFGVRPLFYTVVRRHLLFASEVKALLSHPWVSRRPDIRALDQVFTYWAALPGRTMFEGIREIPPGHSLTIDVHSATPVIRRYWTLRFDPSTTRPGDDHAHRLREALVDATRLRLRADVPVGAYLSGGLDSSAVAAIATAYTTNKLETFSVAFRDGEFDESPYQQMMARALGTRHHVIECRRKDIADVFPEVIWHTETPLLRTGPAPLFLLSSLVRRHGFKVVLTGEGADELFAGYDIFKEAVIRNFWARRPDSAIRPQLIRRLYGWLPGLQRSSPSSLQAFFGQGLTDTADPAYSHRLRWRNARRLTRLFSPEVRQGLDGYDSEDELVRLLDPRIEEWDPLSRAQFVEVTTFLAPYLLSSQGDRVAMAHSVEGRFPFLDHRVAEIAAEIPSYERMVGLREKAVLKRAVSDLVPELVRQRPKQPYRAPVAVAFLGDDAPDYVAEMLSPAAIRQTGLFNEGAVSHLVSKCRGLGKDLGENDNMALVGVLSAQLWHHRFMTPLSFNAYPLRDDIVHVGADLAPPVNT